ncbi:MAG TPA: nickel pincer cofactor biosynthesis protein LarC [Vicinamibacterales bacterium]|nr:nickel pincer cofactor biosynthesis protein LarC [Vicinamibacterales bacterium]
MSRVMYFDCFSGAAGDMILGALLDAGLPFDALQQALGSLGVEHELRVTRVVRAGITANHVEVRARDGEGRDRPRHAGEHDHAHQHPHGDHGHRSLDEIAHLIGHSALSPAGKRRAIELFDRLGEAEAAIHGVPLDRVHLHEVGALDSIIDIVGAVFAMEWFGIDEVVASSLNVGSGTVKISHGTYPVPAPATLRLLTGVPIHSSGPHTELVTPTGALVLSSYARSYGPLPPMAVERIGYGAGTKDFPGVPNVLRVVTGTRVAAAAGPPGAESIVKIECEMDDMNPQLFSSTGDRLFAAGALDVFLTAVQMKKGRPGTLLTVIAPEAARAALCDVLFRETTTLGVRFERMWRETLEREWVTVAVPGGDVRIKVAGRGGEVLNVQPEFDDCLRVAQATGRAVKAVHADALRAWQDRKSP